MSARDAAEWDEAVLGRPAATPFHAWTFLSAYAATAGLSFEPTLVRRDGVVIGGLPSLVRRRGPLRWVNVGLAFAYAGPAVDDAYLDEVLAELLVRSRAQVRLGPTSEVNRHGPSDTEHPAVGR